jgi:ADP-heptose:LPS heptosyltransferase
VCTPLLAALRDAGHDVGLALSDRNADIFAPQMFLARHVLERIPWPRHGSTPASRARAQREIAEMRYDIALIASEEPEAYRLASRIPQRIGFSTGWSKPLKTLWTRSLLTRAIPRSASLEGEDAHEVEILFRLGAGLHGESEPTRDVARLRPLIMRDVVTPPRRVTVVQLSAKWIAIGLERASAGALVGPLARSGAQLVASANEREAADVLAGPAPYVVFDHVEGWMRAIDAARVVVTPDSGAAHLAGMIGVPTIDCFPDENAAAQMRRWHPWAAPYHTFTVSEIRGNDGVTRVARAIDAF